MKTFKLFFSMLIFQLAIFQICSAQVTREWDRYFQVAPYSAYGKCVESDNQGNCIVSGYAKTGSSHSIVTLKYNSQGNLLWQKFCSPAGVNDVNDMVLDHEGNIYMTGFSTLFSDKRMITVKYNPSGDTQWVKIYNGPVMTGADEGKAITLDASGNVYVTGYSAGTGTNLDYLTIKYDNNGNEIWVRTYNYFTNNDNIANDIVTDDSGNVYITGETNYTGTAYFYLTLKYDNAGNLIWANSYFAPIAFCVAKALAIDNSGNIYVTGYGRGVTNSDDYITIKYDPAGNQKWVNLYSATANSIDEAKTIKLIYPLGIENPPTIVVTGTSLNDLLTISYTSDSGHVIWEKRYNGPSNSLEKAQAMDTDDNGNIYVTGYSFDNSTSKDFLTIKYDNAGNEIWNERFNSYGISEDDPKDVSVGPNGAVFVAGTRDNSGSVLEVVKYKEPSPPYTLDLTLLIEGRYNMSENKMVKDSVRVYLRNTNAPYAIIDSAISLLDSNGKATVNFTNAFNLTPYYIMIKHRNSIETWSAGGATFSSNNLEYDFTTSANKAYGNNLIQKGSKFCIYSGDVNQDGVVDATDAGVIDNDATSFVTGNVNTDLTGDEVVDASDISIADNNTYSLVTTVFPSKPGPVNLMLEKNKISSDENTIILSNNYPNPFNPVTVINYQIPYSDIVTLKVYDVSGKEVASLVNEMKNAGMHSVTFNASGLTSGFYFYKLSSNGVEQAKKMTLLK